MSNRACIFGCSGPALSAAEAAFFREADPFGFILFARNVADPAQLRRLTGTLRESVGRDAPILIDQEGGRVARMGSPHWRGWMPALDQVERAGPEAAARSLWLRYRLIAEELRAVGIDTDCAPLADIARPLTHPILRNRCYGTTPGEVAARARAVAEGLLAGGVLPVLKHVPGHGLSEQDSHLDLPVVAADRAALVSEDFAPFAALSDLPLGMTAHIVYPAIDADAPATLSPSAIALIRDEIGFDGLLMTDDLSMHALRGPFEIRAARALAAGCDLILHCNGDMEEMAAVAAGAAPMSAAAQIRADRALALRGRVEPADPAALEVELRGILEGVPSV